ncbi:MAG TPA: hypothetical protein VIJ14_08155 [Rhabdochlamydiaceae bacterium]
MALVQLDLFRDALKQQENIELEEFKKSATKCIKGLFARHNEMEFLVFEMHKKIDKLQEEVYRHG